MSELRECAEGLCDVFGISLDQEGDAAGSELWSAVMGLREIVAKLPKTADGVSVVPGMTVWVIVLALVKQDNVSAVICDEGGVYVRLDKWGPSFEDHHPIYSTPEAAQAAAPAETETNP